MTERFPRGVYGDGDEPDPRFSLANERTFLAWLRTALALFAAAAALEAFSIPAEPLVRLLGAGVLAVTGLGAVFGAWIGWAKSERALRRGASLPGMGSGALIAAGVVVAVIVVAVGTLL